MESFQFQLEVLQKERGKVGELEMRGSKWVERVVKREQQRERDMTLEHTRHAFVIKPVCGNSLAFGISYFQLECAQLEIPPARPLRESHYF